MTDYEQFEINLKLAMIKRVYSAKLITHDTYTYAMEHYNKLLLDK
jgi:hypothetical protein